MLMASVATLLGQVLRKFSDQSLDSVSDGELLREFTHSKSERAFEELARRYGTLVWGVCRRMLTHQQDAEDAFQASFIVLARKAGTIHRREQLGHWLYGVACYAARNVRKCKRRRISREQPWGETLDVPDHRHDLWNELSPLVDDELARLPTKYRLPMVLCCLEGKTYQEAAEQLCWPLGTIAGHVSRGREILRKRLLKRGVAVPSALLALFLSQEMMAETMPAMIITTCMQNLFTDTSVRLAGQSLSPTVTAAVSNTVKQLYLARFALYVVGAIALLTVCVGLRLGWHALAGQRGSGIQVAQSVPAPQLPRADPRFVPLPSDPNVTVLRWRQTDLVNNKTKADLIIKADGRIFIEATHIPSQQVSKWEDRLTPFELQQLAQFTVHDQDFLSFDSDRTWNTLVSEYEFEGDMRSPQDTFLTEIWLNTADQEHRVEWYQLGSTAIWFHEIPAVRQLTDLHYRLQNKVLVMEAGGTNAVNAIAEEFNKILWATYPKHPPFSAEHLTHITTTADSAIRQLTFCHGSKYGNPHFFSASCGWSWNGKLQLAAVTPGPVTKAPALKRRIPNEQ